MGLLALGNLTGGQWAVVGRPFYRAATQTMWLVAILFIPIGAFTEYVYPWAHVTAASALPSSKSVYLEPVFFCERAACYIVVWLVLSWLLSMVSRPELPPGSTPAMRRVGAITLVLLVPTATFAAFDWGMSLEPQWYSSIYGAILTAGGVLAAHALAVSGVLSAGGGNVDEILHRAGIAVRETDEHELQGSEMITLHSSSHLVVGPHLAGIFNELGNLLLAFLMVNTYFALSQFLIIWPEICPVKSPGISAA
jgi:hypothetical protein